MCASESRSKNEVFDMTERSHILCRRHERRKTEVKIQEDRGQASGRTFGAFRCGVGAMRLEETLITIPHTSRCEASTSKRSDLIPLSRQPSAYSRHIGNFKYLSSLVCRHAVPFSRLFHTLHPEPYTLYPKHWNLTILFRLSSIVFRLTTSP